MSSYQTALQNETLINRLNDDETAGTVMRFERTDKQLVDLVIAGDETAFEQIFDRHKRLVAIIANRYFRRPEEVEEIVQIAFAKAFVELGGFRGRYDRSLSSWLAKIASNACLDTLRNQKRKPERLACDLSDQEVESLLQLTATDSADAENEVLDRDLTEKLLAAIPEADRTLLQMTYAEEISSAEIAEIFGWSTSKVKVRAWRARAAMRKVLRKFL